MGTAQIGVNNGINDWIFDGSMHQAWVGSFATAGLGRMIQVDAYFASQAGGGSGGAVAWQNSAWIGFYQNAGGIAAGSGTGGAWRTSTGDVPTPASDSWQFGNYCSAGIYCIYHDDGGLTQVNGASGGNATGGTNVNAYAGRTGSMPAVGTYFVIARYARRGGGWTKTFRRTRRASAWVINHRSVRRAGGWTQVARLAENVPFERRESEIDAFTLENGVWVPGLLRWEGPYYVGTPGAREAHLYGFPQPRAYELRAA